MRLLRADLFEKNNTYIHTYDEVGRLGVTYMDARHGDGGAGFGTGAGEVGGDDVGERLRARRRCVGFIPC